MDLVLLILLGHKQEHKFTFKSNLIECSLTIRLLMGYIFMFKESTIKVAGKVGKKQEKAKSDKPSTAKSGQKSEKKVII